MSPVSRTRRIDDLRRKISDLEPIRNLAKNPAQNRAATPHAHLGGAPGLTECGLFETCPHAYPDMPAAFAFHAGLAAILLKADRNDAPLLWARCTDGSKSAHDFGRPAPQGLAALGLDPARLVLVETTHPREALWAMEEGLRAGAIVAGEIGAAPAYDLTASKRLALATRETGRAALILRGWENPAPSAVSARWRIAAEPGARPPWRGASGLPGLAQPRFRVTLEKARGASPQTLVVEWKNAAFHRPQPAELADPAAAARHVA